MPLAARVGQFWRSTVKIIFASLFALVLVQSAAVAGLATDIPQTNRVILDGKWKPSEQDTQEALVDIQAYLETPSRSTNAWTSQEIREILAHTKDYRVKFQGMVLEGRKVIRCLFLSGSDPDPWSIFYDPRTAKCARYFSLGYT